ncbi:hypothetical protein OCU04_003084 [Sclerotinia nivalis]|uniref:Clr5 domain-containing protein n=1 Tax=Sclerotinia nivalis TaxID=352851 RepID=A0A9X0AVE4_9HELO|nr:hypothetical protein OCU04_003084 [Sclerotinia nivalis]
MNIDEFQDPVFSLFGNDDDISRQEFATSLTEELSLVDNSSYDVRRTTSVPENLRTPVPPVSQYPLLPSGIVQAMNQPPPDHTPPIAPPTNIAHKRPPIVESMSSLPKPARRPALTEHSAEDWECQRAAFTQLYMGQDKCLKEVMKIMEDEHGFRATPRQYKRRIEQWKLDKNIKENDMRVILRKDLKRKREGKKSEFRISGRDVVPQKIERFAQRNKMTEESILEFDTETPGYIACDTPAPTMVDEGTRHHTGGKSDMEDSTAVPLKTVDSEEKRRISTLNYKIEAINSFIEQVGIDPPLDADFNVDFDASFFNYPNNFDNVSDEVSKELTDYALFKIRSAKSGICRRCSSSLYIILSPVLREFCLRDFASKCLHYWFWPSRSEGKITRSIILLTQYLIEHVFNDIDEEGPKICYTAVKNAFYISFAYFCLEQCEAASLELESTPDVSRHVDYREFEGDEYFEFLYASSKDVVDISLWDLFIQEVKDQWQELLDSENSPLGKFLRELLDWSDIDPWISRLFR